MDSFPKKHFNQWLEDMINSDQCPGVQWKSREERTFVIPWCRFNNSVWDKQYFQILKEWAIFKKRHREGDEEEWPQWKCQFRNALNKKKKEKRIAEMSRLMEPNIGFPYKVFQFLDREGEPNPINITPVEVAGKLSPSDCSAFKHPNEYFVLPKRQEFLQGSETCEKVRGRSQIEVPVDLLPGASNVPANFLLEDAARALKMDPEFDLKADSIGQANFTQSIENAIPSHLISEKETQNMLNCIGQGYDITQNENLPSDLASLESSDLMDTSKGPSCRDKTDVSLPKSDSSYSTMDQASPPRRNGVFDRNNAVYSVHYASEKVDQGVISDGGVRFYFGPEIPKLAEENLMTVLYGPQHLEQISLPDPHSYLKVANSRQKDLILQLLEKMTRGLLICSNDQGIFIKRLCKTRVFSWVTGTSKADPVPRNEETLLFDLHKFSDNMQKGLEVPSPEVCLIFGQEVQLDSQKPTRDLLLYLSLTHKVARQLYNDSPRCNLSHDRLLFSSDTFEDKYEVQLMQQMAQVNVNQ